MRPFGLNLTIKSELMDINLLPIEYKHTQCTDCSIRRLALFKGVAEKDISWTQEFRSDQFKVKAKKALYKETEHSDYMFTLYHGWVLQYVTLSNGKRQIIRISLPGDFLGFQADFGGPMCHTAVALTDTVLCAFPTKDIKSMFQQNVGLAMRMADMHARDSSISQNHLVGVGQKTAEERLAYLCVELFHRIKIIYGDNIINEIEFPLTQEDLGDTLGLTQIHVNRTLKGLRERGLMEIKNKRLTIHNIDEMKELGSFDEKILQHSSVFDLA